MGEDIKTFYDLTAERTADEWYANAILLPSIREFLAMMPGNPRVLDLGCGSGYESMRLYREGARVLGIDFSETNIRIARERCPDCKFEVFDFTRLDDRFGIFDGIFANASLIHVAPEKIENVLQRISGILHDEGYLLATIQDGEGINETWSNLTVDGNQLRRTVYCYSESQIKEYTKRHGLRFVKNGFLDESLLCYNWKSYLFQKSSAEEHRSNHMSPK